MIDLYCKTIIYMSRGILGEIFSNMENIIDATNYEFIIQLNIYENINGILSNEALLNPFLVILFIILISLVFLTSNNSISRLKHTLLTLNQALFINSENKQIDIESVDKIIKASGYVYDQEQDIFYSSMDPWQRKMGYCRLYDEVAAPLGMIIDCEPIYFEYKGKRWLIELWKGQYDLTTGCEIGVYNTEGRDLDIPNVFNGTFYNAVSDNERLKISCLLVKNNQELFVRKEEHWWLTGFKLGEFSNPSELIMYIEITFNSYAMCRKFIEGLKQVGYSQDEIIKKGKKVNLVFSKPHTPQPYTRHWLSDMIIQYKNKKMCDRYQEITKDYDTMPERIEAIRQQAPKLFGIIMTFGKPKQLYEKYLLIRKHMDQNEV